LFITPCSLLAFSHHLSLPGGVGSGYAKEISEIGVTRKDNMDVFIINQLGGT
jgi:hypothetical protein